MTALLIIGTICIVVGTTDLIKVKAEARTYRAANRGSRIVEKEEWDKWSAALLKEYNELTGLSLPYPQIQFTSSNFDRAYYNAFSEPYTLTKANSWKDAGAIEKLRTRHNLPSDEEIYTAQEWMYKKQIVNRPTFYSSLAYIIIQCVCRAVHERGYKYGGKDYESHETAGLNWKEVESKYVWIKNDPTTGKVIKEYQL